MNKLVLILTLMVIALGAAVAQPLGGTVTQGASSRGSDPIVENSTAEGGNLTAMNIDQQSITGTWQGYYGNVTGSISLENAGGDSFYDWSLAQVSGEVYATRTQVADWTGIGCGTQTTWEAEEDALGIASTADDGINETYSSTVSSITIGTTTLNNCPGTRPNNSTGLASDFWNVLLNTTASNPVYASILSDDSDAFAGGTADFQLMVPVNVSNNNLATYFFYVELI